MNKGLKKGLGALAAVASLLALGPLAAANAAQPTRTRIDAFANDGTIAVESADGRTDTRSTPSTPTCSRRTPPRWRPETP